MKTILKWFFGLVLLVGVLAVVLLLSLDTILRVVAENRIRAQTGMDAEIGKFHLGLAGAGGDHRKPAALQSAVLRRHAVP